MKYKSIAIAVLLTVTQTLFASNAKNDKNQFIKELTSVKKFWISATKQLSENYEAKVSHNNAIAGTIHSLHEQKRVTKKILALIKTIKTTDCSAKNNNEITKTVGDIVIMQDNIMMFLYQIHSEFIKTLTPQKLKVIIEMHHNKTKRLKLLAKNYCTINFSKFFK